MLHAISQLLKLNISFVAHFHTPKLSLEGFASARTADAAIRKSALELNTKKKVNLLERSSHDLENMIKEKFNHVYLQLFDRKPVPTDVLVI